MKINFIPTLIALALSVLIAYGLYFFHIGENKILLGFGSALFFGLTLILTYGVSYELPRTGVNVRVVSGIFFLIGLIENIVFSFLNYSIPIYVITNGVLILIYILISYFIFKARQ